MIFVINRSSSLLKNWHQEREAPYHFEPFKGVTLFWIFFFNCTCICLCHIFLPVSFSLVVTCWETADLLAILYTCDVLLRFCQVPIPGPGSGMVLDVSIPDLCLLPYFDISKPKMWLCAMRRHQSA